MSRVKIVILGYFLTWHVFVFTYLSWYLLFKENNQKYIMNSPFPGQYDTTSPLPTNPIEDLQLTPEELRILKECNNEGIRKRGIPLAIGSGFLAHVFAKHRNVMMHSKLGTLPFAFVAGSVGYFLGRFTYFPVCYERLMQVPDGLIRQKALSRQWAGSTITPQVGQVIQVDPKTYAQSRPTDIDLPIMSNFDTMPSNLDSDAQQIPIGSLDAENPQKFTSYDELRERNRREYMEKMQKQSAFGIPPAGYAPAQPGYAPVEPGYAPTQPGYPVADPAVPSQPQIPAGQSFYQRRDVPVQPSDPQGPRARKIKTKYGDEWES